MRFKFNIFSLVTAVLFVLAFLCLMFSYLTQFMFYPAMIFFEGAFVMLSIIFVRSYISKADDINQRQEAIVMELASGEDGEKYVMQDDRQDKKARRRRRSEKFEKLLPSIFSILGCVLFLYLFISSIVAHV